jgi:hypothetical protein
MRPADVEQLIADLRDEKPHSGVVAQTDSRMVILVEETEARHIFDAGEARLLLSSPESVRKLFEALDYPEEAFVELHGLDIEAETMSELEGLASTVDEM